MPPETKIVLPLSSNVARMCMSSLDPTWHGPPMPIKPARVCGRRLRIAIRPPVNE
jgi:hypothetical protein